MLLQFIIIIFIIFFLSILLWNKSKIKFPSETLKFKFDSGKELPSLFSLIPSILFGAIFKKQGKLYSGFKDFPNVEIIIGPTKYDLILY